MSQVVAIDSLKKIYDGIIQLAILDGKKQRLVSPTGSRHSWLIDMRRLFTRADYLDVLAEAFWNHFKDELPFQVGGMEVAAIPLVAAILMKSAQRGHPINGFIIRKERKTYGAGNLIEGMITDDRIIIVDDIFNSGGSAEKVFMVLDSVGYRFDNFFVVIDYQSIPGQKWAERRKVEVRSLFTLKDFGLRLSKPRRPGGTSMFETVWTFKSPDPNFYNLVPKSFPATDDERVFFGSDIGLFRALEAATGELLWDFKVETRQHKNIWSAPALHAGRVYFGAYDGNVYCLDAATGAEIWRNTGAEWVGSSPVVAADLNLLFIGLEFGVEGRRGAVAAIDLETGETVWSQVTKRYTHASPAYSQSRQLVACGSNDNELLLFNAKTGEKLWRFTTRGDGAKGSIRHAPAFFEREGQIITGCADGYIYVIDIESGEEVWSYKTGNTIYTIPLIVEDKAYIGSTDKSMYILDLNKKEVHTKFESSAKIYCPPALIEGKVYFGSCDGSIYELDPEQVLLEGVAKLPDALTNKIAYAPKYKLFYALTYTNEMFALRRS